MTASRFSLHNHVPQRVRRHKRIGAVIVHGFTSDNRAVLPLQRLVQQFGMPTEAPLLRGHGGHYRDLRGACWDHWMDDLRAARSRLRQQVDQVVLIGFSMGGLLTLASAAQDPDDVAAIVALAPAIRIAHPLAPIAWMARGWMPFVPMGKAVGYSDPALARADDSYNRLAIDAFCSFYNASRQVERLLPRVHAPILLAHATGDRVIRPESSQIAFDRVSSVDKQVLWLQRSGHILLDDCEAQTVLDHVRQFLHDRFGARHLLHV